MPDPTAPEQRVHRPIGDPGEPDEGPSCEACGEHYPCEAIRESSDPTAPVTADDLREQIGNEIAFHLGYRSSRATDAVWAKVSAELERLHSWDGLLSLLDEHWPEDIFPTEPDSETRDPGPRIVSLLRWVERLRAELAEATADREHWHAGHDDLTGMVKRLLAERDALTAARARALHRIDGVVEYCSDNRIDPPAWVADIRSDLALDTPETATEVHGFKQNPAATQVSVCVCGKWRDHHVHGADPCGCDACRTPGDADA